MSERCDAPYRTSASAAALANAAASRGFRAVPASRISGASGEVDAWMCSRSEPGSISGTGSLVCSRVSGSDASRPNACAKLTAAGPDARCPSSTTRTNAAAV